MKVAAVEPRLELRLADGRLLRLVGLDPAARTPTDAALGDDARAKLAALVGGRDVTVEVVDTKPDRWARRPAFAFLTDPGAAERPGGLAVAAVSLGLGRYGPEPAAHACRDLLLEAERQAREAALGLWRDPYYAVVAADDRAALDSRSSTVVLAEGRLTTVDAGPYRTKLRFAARDGSNRALLAASVLPRVMKSFEKQGVTFSSMIGRTLRFRGLLDVRFGPEVELTGPDALEILPAGASSTAPNTADHG